MSSTKIALLIDLNSFPLPRKESTNLAIFDPPTSSPIRFPHVTTVKQEPIDRNEQELQLDDGNITQDPMLDDLLTSSKLNVSPSKKDLVLPPPLVVEDDNLESLTTEILLKPKIEPLSENDHFTNQTKVNTTNENFQYPLIPGEDDFKHLTTEALKLKIEAGNQTPQKLLNPKFEIFEDSPEKSPVIRQPIFSSESGQSESNRTERPVKSPCCLISNFQNSNSNSAASFLRFSPSPRFSLLASGSETPEKHEDFMGSIPSLLEMNLKRLQEAILEQLIKDSTICGEFDPSNVQWTYKFFDSARPTNGAKRNKRFMPLDLTSFETFEEDLAREVTAFTTGKTFNDPGKLESLSASIKNIMSDLHWSHTFTPNTSSSKSTSSQNEAINNRNYIYVYQCVPRSESEMLEYTGSLTTMISSQNFLNALLPKAFFMELHRKHKIRVNLVDLWYLHNGFGLEEGVEWKSGEYHKPIPHVLHYLNGGKILPITVTDIGKELPPLKALLKGILGFKASSGDFCNKTKKTGREKVVTGRERVEGIKNLVQPVINKPSHSSTRADRIENGEWKEDGRGLRSDHPLLTFNLTDRVGLDDRYVQRSRSKADLVLHNKGRGHKYHHNTADNRLSVPNTSFLKKHISEKQILVCASEWKNLKRRDQERTEILKQVFTAAPAPIRRPTPKKAVRRNLFSTVLTSGKDIENLIKMSNSCLHSPGFRRSPARATRSLLPKSPYSAATTSEIKEKILKSKRRLHLDSLGDGGEPDDEENSPNLRLPRPIGRVAGVLAQENGHVLCPESPATPVGKRIRRHTSSNLMSSEKKVVQESPESFSNYHSTSPMKRIASTSFYSISSSEKSRVWEKSGNLLKEAKIKESVEHSQLVLEESFLTKSMQAEEEDE